MNKKELKHFEDRLLRERNRALKELGHFDQSVTNGQSSGDSVSAYSFHMADQGTDAMEREKTFLFASKEGRFLYHIDEALRRLYRTPKGFGRCEQCEEEIGFERLDALPHTRLCIRCKELEETGASD